MSIRRLGAFALLAALFSACATTPALRPEPPPAARVSPASCVADTVCTTLR